MKQSKKKENKNFKIWSTHFDFSEINKNNYKDIFHDYFKLSTKKITYLALMISLNICFTLISHFILGLIPKIAGFLTFNITLWTIISTFMALNFFYAFIFTELTIWFRLSFDFNIPGIIAINLNDLTFLILLSTITFLINFIRFKLESNDNQKLKRKKYFWVLFAAVIMSALFTSGLDVFYNWNFLITIFNHWYGLSFDPKTPWILITVFWFNLLQMAINIAFFFLIYKISYTLINNYFMH